MSSFHHIGLWLAKSDGCASKLVKCEPFKDLLPFNELFDLRHHRPEVVSYLVVECVYIPWDSFNQENLRWCVGQWEKQLTHIAAITLHLGCVGQDNIAFQHLVFNTFKIPSRSLKTKVLKQV